MTMHVIMLLSTRSALAVLTTLLAHIRLKCRLVITLWFVIVTTLRPQYEVVNHEEVVWNPRPPTVCMYM